jgi:N-acetylneuraminic acid mutarotase
MNRYNRTNGMSKRVGPAYAWLSALTIFFSLYLPPAFAQGKWMDLAPFPEPHEEVIAQAANGKMYVFAGLVSAPVWQPVGMVYEYDPATNKWTKKKPMALPAHHLTLTEYNGKIYVFGGFTAGKVGKLAAWTPISNAFEYDPVNDSWRDLAAMPTKRGAGVAVTVGDKMYVIGGATVAPGATNPAIHPTTAQRVVGTVEEYDPKTNQWRARATMPTPRNHTAAGVVNGKIYVIGGRIGAAFIAASSNLNNVEAYDPATDTWSGPLAKMPTARSGLCVGVHDGRVYVAGGEWQNAVEQTAYRAFEAYDPATNSWSVMPPMVLARHGVAGGVIANRFYAISGDVQSSGTGIEVSTAAVAAFEFAK